MLNWKPVPDTLTCAEMIRHLLEGEFRYHQILIGGGSKALADLSNPFKNKDKSYREDFLSYIKSLSASDLENVQIDRSDVGYVRYLGDKLLSIAYHESVHTVQLFDYMRTMGIDRLKIWD